MKRQSAAAGGDNLPRNFSWVIPGVLAGSAAPTTAPQVRSLGKTSVNNKHYKTSPNLNLSKCGNQFADNLIT